MFLDSINVKNINDSDTTFGIFIEDTVNGKVIADRSTVNAGESVTLKLFLTKAMNLINY